MTTSAARVTSPRRPSYSPLSAASKSRRNSPIATRKARMEEREDVNDAAREHVDGQRDDDRSSSLSEPDEENEDDGEHVDEEDEENTVNGDGLITHPRSQDEIDSEAETERLDQTPTTLRKQPDALGRTPSKLSQTAKAEEEVLSEPASPVPAGASAASSTSALATAGRKRKRSGTEDSSLTSTGSAGSASPRKRAHTENGDAPADIEAAIDEAELPSEAAERTEDTPTLDEPTAVAKKGWKPRRGKPKGKKAAKESAEEAEEQAEEQPPEEHLATEEDIARKKEASVAYVEVHKVFRAFAEKAYNERLASVEYELSLLANPHNCTHPEYLRMVAAIDARLHKQRKEADAYYKYKLQAIKQRTLADRTQLHSQYFQEVREIRETELYKLGENWYAIQKERRSSHADDDAKYIYKFPTKKSQQIKQQAKYNLEVSVLSGVAKYVGFPAAPDINGVQGGELDSDLKAMKISKRVVQPTNTPAATAPGPPPSRPTYLPAPPTASFAQDERQAHDQFLEQNAWARPQPPLQHAHVNTPGISHTPDWAEQPSTHSHTHAHHSGPAKQVMRNLSGRNSSPFATPGPTPLQHPGQRTRMEQAALHSDGPAAEPDGPLANVLPSGFSGTGATDRDRAFFHNNHGPGGSSAQTSPLAMHRQRQQPSHSSELHVSGGLGWRNVSGASTIDALPEPDRESEPPRIFDRILPPRDPTAMYPTEFRPLGHAPSTMTGTGTGAPG